MRRASVNGRLYGCAMRVRGAVTTVVLALLIAAPAHALPGDPPFAPVSPDDGATFAPSEAGVPVAYTCPTYRVSDAGFPVFGGPSEYGLSVATSPELGTDGRLRSDNVVALDTGHRSNTIPADQCLSTFAAGGSDPPQTIPGTYYWQVWRICTGCPGSYETGPVRTLILRTPGRPALAPPRRAYAGYPAAISIRLDGIADGATMTLERRRGTSWRPLGEAAALQGRGEVIATLPRGRQRLRAVVRSGSETLTSAERVLRVRPARRWKTRKADEGVYTATFGVRMRVTRGGREIRGFESDVAMTCPGVLPGQFTTQIGQAAIKRIRVAPDGTFIAAATSGDDTAMLVRGKLARGKVTGSAELSLNACTGVQRFTAKR
jgi:hypothetical protein